MLVTLSGIVILVNPLQPENVPLFMLVTLPVIIISVIPLQFWNAFVFMLFALVITTVFNDSGTYAFDPNINPKCLLLVPELVFPTNGIVKLVKLLQP